MANLSSYKKYPFAPFLLFFVSTDLFVGISGVGNEPNISANKLSVINHEPCQSCPGEVSSLKDVDTYSVLKFDPRASLPSSFTICVSVLVRTIDLHPNFFYLTSK